MINKSKESRNIEIKEFYNSSQAYLDRLNKHDELVFAPYVNLCKRYLPPGSSILDAGCGAGVSSSHLAKAGFRVIGIDVSALFVAEGMRKYKEQEGLSFKVSDVAKMPFSSQSFDAVCSYDLLEHVINVKAVLTEMSRVVKKGGLLIILASNHLNPVEHLKEVIKWQKQDVYKPWEAKSRFGALYKGIRTFFLAINKVLGLNKKIYYLEPVLSNNEGTCGRDFDATWLINWFDLENTLKELGFSIKDTPAHCEDRIMRKMRTLRVPKAIQLFYLKMKLPCLIVGVNK